MAINYQTYINKLITKSDSNDKYYVQKVVPYECIHIQLDL